MGGIKSWSGHHDQGSNQGALNCQGPVNQSMPAWLMMTRRSSVSTWILKNLWLHHNPSINLKKYVCTYSALWGNVSSETRMCRNGFSCITVFGKTHFFVMIWPIQHLTFFFFFFLFSFLHVWFEMVFAWVFRCQAGLTLWC